MHELIAGHPEVQRITEQLDQVSRAEAHIAARSAKVTARQAQAQERYVDAYRRAAETGGEFPDPPKPPAAEPNLTAEFQHTRQRLEGELAAAVKSIASEVAAKAREVEVELLAQVLDAKVSDLGPVAAEVEGLRRAVQTCTGDDGELTISVPMLVEAALAGGSLLHLSRRRAYMESVPEAQVEREFRPHPDEPERWVIERQTAAEQDGQAGAIQVRRAHDLDRVREGKAAQAMNANLERVMGKRLVRGV